MSTESNIGAQDIDSLIRVIHHILCPDLKKRSHRKCLGRQLILALFLSMAVAPAFAGCAVNRAAATLTASLDGRYLVQSGGGRAALWVRQGQGWRLSWRRVAAVNSLAVPAGTGGEPVVILGAGGALTAFDRKGERWSVDGPSRSAVRRLAAADLNGDGLDETVALFGPTLGGESQTLIVFDMAGREAARRGDVNQAVAAMAHGDFDGNERQELAIVERGQTGALILGVFALTPEGFMAMGKAGKLPAGFRDFAPADLDGDGRTDLVAAFERSGRTELRAYRYKDGELHPTGKTMKVNGTGDLLPAGGKLVTLRMRNGRWWSQIVIGWEKDGPAVQTKLERFRAGTFLVPMVDGGLELLAAGSREPQSLLSVE